MPPRGEHQAEADLHREAIGDRDRAHGPLLETPTIRIPIRLQRRGGRKLIMTPEGVPGFPRKPTRDETLIKALVRAHRWRRRIESGQARSISDLAEQEGASPAPAGSCRSPVSHRTSSRRFSMDGSAAEGAEAG
jgi:hypothetical protein